MSAEDEARKMVQAVVDYLKTNPSDHTDLEFTCTGEGMSKRPADEGAFTRDKPREKNYLVERAR